MSERTKLSLTAVVVALAAMLLASGGKGCTLPVLKPSTPPMIVMLHEAMHGPLPAYALGAANELAASGREVRPEDDDLLNGVGEVPKWLKPALEPGRAIMGGSSDEQQKDDALILLDGERVVKAMKMPATKAEILEAVK